MYVCVRKAVCVFTFVRLCVYVVEFSLCVLYLVMFQACASGCVLMFVHVWLLHYA